MDLFELNNNLEIQYVDEDIVIIDNIYKNFNDLQNFCIKLEKTFIRNNEKHIEKFLNCRTSLNVTIKPDLLKILEETSKKINGKDNSYNRLVTINSIKIIDKSISKEKLQHWPHRDAGVTALIYIDQFENGGTIIYKDPPSNILKKIESKTGYFRNTSELEIKKIIKSKPNRLVIFNALKLHGSYIEDYSIYENNERITQIIFPNIY